jgi:hypothetical protein
LKAQLDFTTTDTAFDYFDRDDDMTDAVVKNTFYFSLVMAKIHC